MYNHISGTNITLEELQVLKNGIIPANTTIVGLPANITINNTALKVYVLSVNDTNYDNINIQDTINNITTLKVQIPYTVTSGTVSLPSHSITISDADLSSEGESNVIVSFTYDAQTALSGTGVFTIDDSSSTGDINDNIYKAKK